MRIALMIAVLLAGCARPAPRDGRYLAWVNYCRACADAPTCDKLWDARFVEPLQ